MSQWTVEIWPHPTGGEEGIRYTVDAPHAPRAVTEALRRWDVHGVDRDAITYIQVEGYVDRTTAREGSASGLPLDA